MKQNKTNILRTLLALLLITTGGVAQIMAQDAMTPYSRFGYGILRGNATSAQRQMGGVGYAMSGGRQINVMNPASYAAIDSLTFLFDMGMDFTTLKSTENGDKDRQFGGGLDYITMQFPLGKRMGMSIGLLPYSSVGYSFGSEIDNGTDTRQGLGGINQLYAGVSGRLFKGFSVGVNFSYLFGTTTNDTYVTSDYSTSLFEQLIEVRDWHFEAGIQYNVALSRRNRLGFGLVYSPGKTLLGNARVIKYDLNSDEKRDTVATSRLRNNFSLPDTWGAGVSWEWNNSLTVEADFTYQPWSKAKFREMDNFIATRFEDRWQVGLGAQFVPKERGGYLERVAYRLGGFYNHDYMRVADNSVREYGLSLGFGLPTNTTKTVINLGFEWRHRQAHPNPLLKENYFSVTLGINFNELWFYQNKIR
ncbi:MAG: hypothetical protein NC336_08700 [Clostridium sp.]|nr:hypothetical protein [Clostridium sp.]